MVLEGASGRRTKAAKKSILESFHVTLPIDTDLFRNHLPLIYLPCWFVVEASHD